MPDYNEETKLWLEHARLYKPPYAHSYQGGTLLLSVIRGNDRKICEQLKAQGFSHWRGVAETRPLKLNLTARVVRGRVRWDPSESQAKGAQVIVRLSIDQPHPEATYFPEDNETCRCLVLLRGEEAIETLCSRTKQLFKSQFFADTEEETKQMAKHQWLLAIADGIKGIPGAEILMGPLIRLREDELEEERNREIDKMFAENKQLNEKTLNSVLKLSDNNVETQALLQLTVRTLDAEFKRQRGESTRLEVSPFPLPITKGLLIKELRVLWPISTDEIKTVLAEENYQEIEATTNSDFIVAFVNSMPGNDGTKLFQIFSSLHAKRPDSKIIAFAAKNLSYDDRPL
jgi:hypothetical protein